MPVMVSEGRAEFDFVTRVQDPFAARHSNPEYDRPAQSVPSGVRVIPVISYGSESFCSTTFASVSKPIREYPAPVYALPAQIIPRSSVYSTVEENVDSAVG